MTDTQTGVTVIMKEVKTCMSQYNFRFYNFTGHFIEFTCLSNPVANGHIATNLTAEREAVVTLADVTASTFFTSISLLRVPFSSILRQGLKETSALTAGPGNVSRWIIMAPTLVSVPFKAAFDLVWCPHSAYSSGG
jgi:hypothetical protein